MLSQYLYEVLEQEIKLKHGDRTKAARKIGISKEMIHAVMNRLKAGEGISTKTLEKICSGLDCHIVINIKNKKTK